MTKLTTIAVDRLQSMQGTKLGISPWIQLSQSMVNQFADVTNDHQFIHIDPERADTETPFGGTIAHGFLTLSHLTQMAESTLPVIKGVRMSINYGFDRIRFKSESTYIDRDSSRQFTLLKRLVDRQAL